MADFPVRYVNVYQRVISPISMKYARQFRGIWPRRRSGVSSGPGRQALRALISVGEMMFKWAEVDGCDWCVLFLKNYAPKWVKMEFEASNNWEILGAGPIVDGGHQTSVAEWCAMNNARWTSENDPGIRGFITRSCDFFATTDEIQSTKN